MIHSTSNSTPQPGAVPPVEPRTNVKSASLVTGRDTLEISSTTALREALAALPEVRPEAVEKGRQLASDANYPPRAIIEDVARLIIQSRDLTNEG